MSNERRDEPGGGESFASLFDATRRDTGRRGPPVAVGEKREVTVIKVGRDAIFVSLDGKHEGFIERSAFGEGIGDLREGTRLLARVVDAGNGRDGAPKLVPLLVRGEEGSAEAVPVVGGPAAAAAGPVIAEGLRVKGAVTRVERYGVFVQITGTQGRSGRGLVPAAELGAPRNADLRKLFPVGAAIEAKVVRIEDDGKIRLSVIALRDDEEQAAFREHRKSSDGGESPAAPRTPGQKPAPRSFGTLGDLLNARRKPGALERRARSRPFPLPVAHASARLERGAPSARAGRARGAQSRCCPRPTMCKSA
jgi:small subunit ribosomal protein S1